MLSQRRFLNLDQDEQDEMHDQTLIAEDCSLDLNTLALKYSSNDLPSTSISENLTGLSIDDPTTGASCSSIDNLIDSFFTAEKPNKRVDSIDLNKLNYQRTKSISICGGEKILEESEDMGAFSLSDLANEFLLTSDKDQRKAACTSEGNLDELIEFEFDQKMSLSAGKSVRAAGGESASTTTPAQPINFNNILIMNKEKQSMLSNKLSTSYEMASSICSSLGRSTSSLAGSANTSPRSVQFLAAPTFTGPELGYDHLFNLRVDSLLGGFLRHDINEKELIIHSKLLDKKLSYLSQMRRAIKRREIMAKSRRKIRIEINETSRNRADKSSKSSKKSSSSTRSQDQTTTTSAIKVFDFSIPSPDDLVLAKQKLAFKNSRYK